MIALLAKRLIRGAENVSDPVVRRAYGTLCGAVGIVLNLLLFLGKLLAGSLSGSIAITADAFNNLSDAGSSAVTLLGFRLAGRKPDPEHPFGHGRIEYVSGLVVAGMILLMGVELVKSSVGKILRPEDVTLAPLAVAILAVSVAVKLYMGLYNRSVGKSISSPAMLATARDSFSDAAATAAVLVATVLGKVTGLRIDGWVGLLVACLILRAAWQAAKETLSPLLGQAPDDGFVRQIQEIVMAHEGILGIHDLVVHDYGPGRVMISLHAEVPAEGNILELHDVIDNAEMALQRQLGCEAVIHMDPVVTGDGVTAELRERVAELVKNVDPHATIHDFRMVTGPTHTNLIFDAVVPYGSALTNAQAEERIRRLVRDMDGNYYAVVRVENAYVR
ncbi:MAG: cation transporter [Ruminococcaceae bacterium]|nr:cation transporter [Oscillospiraceae bacterium]